MSTLNITRGSDINFTFQWVDKDGDPVDLSGWDVLIFEPHPLLDGHLTIEMATAEMGRIKGRIEWSDDYKTGRIMSFHVWIKKGIEDRTSHRIMINVSNDYYLNPAVIMIENPVPASVPAPVKVRPEVVTDALIDPPSGPVGTRFQITRATFSGSDPMSVLGQLMLGVADVTGQIEDGWYTSTAEGTLTFTDTATNSEGSATSTAAATVTAAVPADMPPASATPPTITGTAVEGETLTGADGTWTGTTPITFGYRWLRDGSAITGATAISYVLTAADVGAVITLEVTATNSVDSVAATSLPTATVEAAAVPVDIVLSFDGATIDVQNAEASGTYADGTPWASGPGEKIIPATSTPAPATADRTTSVSDLTPLGQTGVTAVHGAMINPGMAQSGTTLADKQAANYGFGSGDPGQGYDEFVVSTNLDYSAPHNASMSSQTLTDGTYIKAVSVMSDVARYGRPALEKLVPFTIVSAAPAPGDFRPPHATANKTPWANEGDIDASRFPNLDASGIAVPDYATTLAALRFVSWQHTYNVLSRNIMVSADGAPVYGGDFRIYMEAMLACCLDSWTVEQKTEVAKLLIQKAIDIAGRAEEGGIWQDNGGHCSGRKPLVAFAAHILGGHTRLAAALEIKAQGANNASKPTPVGASVWGDDAQVGLVTQGIIDEPREFPFTQGMLGWPEFAQEATRGDISDPTNWQNAMDLDTSGAPTDLKQGYRHITACVQAPAALALRLMGARILYNNKTWFDYVDRYMTARIARGSAFPDGASNDVSAFVRDTWQAHRGAAGLWTDPNKTSGVLTLLGMGQSDMVYPTEAASYYQKTPYPALDAENLTVVQQNGSGKTSDTLPPPTVTKIEFGSPQSAVNPFMYVLANALNHIAPGQQFGLIEAAEAGTGRNWLMDDANPGPNGRQWAYLDDLLTTAAGAGLTPNRMAEYWYANDGGSMGRFLEEWSPYYFRQRADGSEFILGNVNPDSLSNPTINVDHCLWDFNTASPDDMGQGVLRRTVPYDLIERHTTAARRDGMNAFANDSRFQALGGVHGPSALGGHADETHAVDLYETGYSFFMPSFLRLAGKSADPSRFTGITVSPDGLTVDVTFTPANGGVLGTQASLSGMSPLTNLAPFWQEIYGFHIHRAGDPAGWMIVTPDPTSPFESKYQGTVTIHDDTTARIVLEEPMVEGDALYYNIPTDLFRSDGVYAYEKDGGQRPDWTENQWRQLRAHTVALEHVPEYTDATADYPFWGLRVGHHCGPFDINGTPPTAWDIQGGENTITISAAPTPKAASLSGGENTITVTEA